MKKMKKIVYLVLCLALCFAAVNVSACGNNNGKGFFSQFGEFSYKGKMLNDYAVNTISADQAKKIISVRNSGYSKYSATESESVAELYGVSCMSLNADRKTCTPPDSMINNILRDYAGCSVTTKYYIDSSEEVQSKTDSVTGLDFKSVLQDNRFTPFNQLVAKNVIVFTELIDYMEEENKAFATSDAGVVAPFKNIFSYHTDAEGNLIIQIRDYAEIASSVGGGIGCSYRQDTEILYDAGGKMIMWQTSLGLASSTPQGTIKEGYILEMNVEWIEKI